MGETSSNNEGNDLLKFNIISVESRKGGVGKTTAALNLAALFLQLDFSVLLIDLDITGTNSAYAEESPFWKETVNSVKIKNADKLIPANLLELFDKRFMVGDSIPEWSNKFGNEFYYDAEKINIIGSDIYENNEPGVTYICNPAILFDELHSYWLIELIKLLCNNLALKAKKKFIVVVDNSPGFVGIVPALHDWLTDIGPDNAKILTVASLDVQDLKSCSKSIEELHGRFVNKFQAAKLYKESVEGKGNEIEINKHYADFFVKIVSRNLSDIAMFTYTKNLDIIKKYVDDIEGYQGLLFNKVPKEIKSGTMIPDFSVDINFKNAKKLIFNNHGDIYREKMIPYNDYIDYQFTKSIFNKYIFRNQRNDRLSHRLNRYFERILKGIDILPEYYEFQNESCDHILKVIMKYKRIYDGVWEKFKSINNIDLYRMNNIEWSPDFAINVFSENIQSIISPFYGYYDDYDLENINDHDLNINSIIKKLKAELAEYHNIQELPGSELYNSYMTVIKMSTRLLRIDERDERRIVDLFVSIFKYQNERINEMNNKYKSRKWSIPMLLMIEKDDEDKYVLPGNIRDMKFFNLLNHTGDKAFILLYEQICSAQARIIDLKKDMLYICRTISNVMWKEANIEIVIPEIRDLIDKVVVYKKISHFEGDQKIFQNIKNYSYMIDFQAALKTVCKKWGIYQDGF